MGLFTPTFHLALTDDERSDFESIKTERGRGGGPIRHEGRMKISEAVKRLQKMADKHGDVEVYFDCPKCGQSFTPNTLAGVAVHLTESDHLGRKSGRADTKDT